MQPRAAITAIHHCLPARRLTQAELEARFGAKNTESIAKLSGIRERRVIEAGQTTTDLAQAAADRLLRDRASPRESIDLLLVATQTGDYQVPCSAFMLHERLGLAGHCATFDINLGCTSYPYALSVAQGFFAQGLARRALVINAEVLTTVIHPQDRSLVTLHGDGAVATLLDVAHGDEGLLGFYFSTDSSGWRYLCLHSSGTRLTGNPPGGEAPPKEGEGARSAEYLQMNGQAIFHFSVHQAPETIRQAMSRFGVTMADVDLVLLHQANRFMIEQIYKRLGVPPEKQFFYLENVGNLSGASTPAVFSEAVRAGRVRPGSRILLGTFGAGLSCAVALVKIGESGLAPVAASIDLPAEK